MTDLLNYSTESQSYSNYQDVLDQQKEYAKSLLSEGAQTLAESSPLLVDSFRNVQKLYSTGKKFYKQLGELKGKAEEGLEKVQAKGKELLSSAEQKVEDLKTQATESVGKVKAGAEEGLTQVKSMGETVASKVKALPKEVEMKEFKSPILEDVTPKGRATFVSASEKPEAKSISRSILEKIDNMKQGKVKSEFDQVLERDPEDPFTSMSLSQVKSQAIDNIAQKYNPLSGQYESFSKALGEAPTIEDVGKQAVQEASEALKTGVEGLQATAETAAKTAAETGSKLASMASVEGEALSTTAKTAAESLGKEAAATVGDLALEIIPGAAEIVGTGALLYQGIKDIFTGEHTPKPVAIGSPVFNPGVANPLG